MASVMTFQPKKSDATSSHVTGVQHVRLERLPNLSGDTKPLQFPEMIADRIWFDAEHKRLAFRGFMSKATYDRLHALSNDSAYLRAIDELFRTSIFEEATEKPRSFTKLLPIAAISTVALLAAALALPIRLLIVR